MNERKQYRAPAIERAARTLEYLSGQPGGASLSEIARALGMGKSSALGILRALAAEEWVARDGESYSVGLGLARLAGVRPLAVTARPFMEELAEKLGNTVCVGRFSEEGLIIDASVQGRGALSVGVKTGLVLPLYAAATGKAYLSALNPDLAAKLLAASSPPRFTDRSIVDPEKFLAEARLCAERGWAADDEEYLKGVRAVAAPVVRNGRAIGALWVVGLTGAFGDDVFGRAGDGLARAAALVSRLV